MARALVSGLEDCHNRSRRQPRGKLLRTDNLTLDMAIKIGQASQTTKRHAMNLSQPESRNQTTVDALQTPCTRESHLKIDANTMGVYIKEENALLMEKTCSKYHKLNHFAAVCLSKSCKVHYSVEGQSNDACDAAGNVDHVFI